MREIRSSGSVEGVLGNHDSYSDSRRQRGQIRQPVRKAWALSKSGSWI
jgi:hypothetical protein